MRKELNEHWHKNPETLWQVLEVEFSSDVRNSVGRLFVPLNSHLVVEDVGNLRVYELDVARNILKSEGGQNVLVLRLLLPFLQVFGFFDNGKFFVLRECAIESFHPLLLDSLSPLLDRAVWRVHQSEFVVVVQQVLLN